MAYIFPSESATGTIDGSNKTFTTANNIFLINFVTVDGVIYTGSVSYIAGTNSFTLGDAPVASVTVAYYDSIPSLPSGTSITVAECRAEFLKRKKDISDIDDISGTFLQWCNYINRFAYRELCNLAPENYIKNTAYNTTPGTATYPVPSDFQDIIPQGTGLYYIDNAGNDTERRLALTSFGSTSTGFYINSSALTFTPVPTEAKAYRLRYIPLLSDLTAETDEMRIPKRFSMHIMDVLDACYNLWDEDQQAEVFNDERVVRTMQELVQFIAPQGQVCGTPDFSQAYYY